MRTTDRSICIQRNIFCCLIRQVCIINLEIMCDHAIASCHFLNAISSCGNGLTRIFIRCCYQPAVFIYKKLMYTDLVRCRSICKFCMIDHICFSVRVNERRVVTLCNFCHIHGIPLVISHQLHTNVVAAVGIAVVHDIFGKNCAVSVCIHIWAIWCLGLEYSHVVATVWRIEAIGHE